MLAACRPSPSTYPDISSRQESLSVCKLLRSGDQRFCRLLGKGSQIKKEKKEKEKRKQAKERAGRAHVGTAGGHGMGKPLVLFRGHQAGSTREACGALQSSAAPPFPC